MSLADLTHAAVLAAIEEFQKLGRAAFLEKYGYGEARSYFLVHEDKLYDSKAIAGVAHGYLEGQRPLRPQDFSGGDKTVRAKLTELNFEVTRPRVLPASATSGQVVSSGASLQPQAALSPAQDSRTAGRPLGRAYVQADEKITHTPAVPFAVDPDLVDRASRAHARTQNALARFLTEAGIEPRSPDLSQGDPAFDLAWALGERVFVAEVKSLTADNEEQQLRLGLGQVLRYRHQLATRGHPTVGVLVAERQPSDASWTHLCEELRIQLAWFGRFDLLACTRLVGR